MGAVQLSQGYIHCEETVYFLPISHQEVSIFICLTLKGWKAESIIELTSGLAPEITVSIANMVRALTLLSAKLQNSFTEIFRILSSYKMKLFVKIVPASKLLTIFAKYFILDVWQSSEDTYGFGPKIFWQNNAIFSIGAL